MVGEFASAGSCGTGAPEWAMQHPNTLMNWMRSHSVRDIQSFVCCLPQEYRSNFAVAHSSQAAQNGTPENPRVLMFNDLRTAGGLNMSLSINSGAAGMRQADSVEIAFRNPRNGSVEYYDMNFASGSPRMSNSNPAACMSCHGQYGSNFEHGGARPLFRSGDRWPTFVGGTGRCQAVEDNLFARSSQRAVAAIRTTPRFQCLDQNQLGSGKKGGSSESIDGNERLHANLVRLSSALTRLNTVRAAALVMNVAHYNQFKYFLLGYDQCASVTKTTDWLPAQKMSELYARVKLLPQVRSARSLRDAELAGTARIRAEVSNQRALLARRPLADALRNGYSPASTALSCASGGRDARNGNVTSDSPMARINLDNRLRSDDADFNLSASLRLFYEGNGSDITDLSMTPASENVSHNGASPVSGELLFRDPELSAYFTRRDADQPGGASDRMNLQTRDVTYTSKISQTRLCQELARKSLAAFQSSGRSQLPAGRSVR